MMTSLLYSRMPSGCLALLEEAFQAVDAANAASLLDLSATCLDEYAEEESFRQVSALLREAAAGGREDLQTQALARLANGRHLKFALARHADVLARAAGLRDRVEDLEATVGLVRNNPIPWWFPAKFGPSSSAISLFGGALAVGGPQSLEWLVAFRDILEAGRLPESFSSEPYLLWIPDEVHQAPLLHATGGIVVHRDEEEVFEAINPADHLKIRALLPPLGSEERLEVDRRDDLKKPRILEAWRDGKISPRMLDHLFRRKYQIVKTADAPDRNKPSGSKMASWAFRIFQHRIRTTQSCLAIPPNVVMEGVPEPWISFDLWMGGIPTNDVWAPLAQIEGLHLFVRGNVQMRSGIYDRHFKTAGDEVSEDVRTFFKMLETRLNERIQEHMPKIRVTPVPPPVDPFEETLPGIPIPEEGDEET